MNRRPKRPFRGRGRRPRPEQAPTSTQLKIIRLGDSDRWQWVHPRCTRERAEDLEEVQAMIAAGEWEVAQDELRWLLEGCGDFVAAHQMLGEIALEQHDWKLARGHFGYAHRISLAAVPPGFQGQLPYELPDNAAFFESTKGLAWSLGELAQFEMAIGALRAALTLDRSDPLAMGELVSSLRDRAKGGGPPPEPPPRAD